MSASRTTRSKSRSPTNAAQHNAKITPLKIIQETQTNKTIQRKKYETTSTTSPKESIINSAQGSFKVKHLIIEDGWIDDGNEPSFVDLDAPEDYSNFAAKKPSEIIPGLLYLGGLSDAINKATLQQLRIKVNNNRIVSISLMFPFSLMINKSPLWFEQLCAMKPYYRAVITWLD